MMATAAGTTAPSGGEQAGDGKHHPWDQRDPAADRVHGDVDQPVDGAVVLGDREEESHPDEDEEQVAREAGNDVVGGLAGDRGPDDERCDERERTHVNR